MYGLAQDVNLIVLTNLFPRIHGGDNMVKTVPEFLNLLKDNYGIESIGADSTFDDLGFDDLDKIELQFFIESEFGIEMENGLTEKWTTVKEAIDYLKEKNLIIE